MRHLRIFVLGLAALLLPVHATAAVAVSVAAKMSCCAEMMAANGQEEIPVVCTHAHDEQAPGNDQGCNSCGDCHLASTLMISASSLINDALRVTAQHGVSPAPTHVSFISKPLPRPPRHC